MKILFLCTHNSCRSILAEAIFNHLAPNEVRASSAGSAPSGKINPRALALQKKNNISTDGLQSKSWDDLEGLDQDIVITVCDNPAGETCPAFFGKSIKGHWGMPDPSQFTGADAEIDAAFEDVFSQLADRIGKLTDEIEKRPELDHLHHTIKALEAH